MTTMEHEDNMAEQFLCDFASHLVENNDTLYAGCVQLRRRRFYEDKVEFGALLTS